MKYKSRISGLMGTAMILPMFLIVPMIAMVIDGENVAMNILSIAILLAVLLVFVPIYKSITFTIESGFMVFGNSKKIDINNIVKLRESYNPISSAAMSLNRLEVKCKEKTIFGDVFYISPINQEQFIEECLRINPKIEVVRKEKRNFLLDWDIVK